MFCCVVPSSAKEAIKNGFLLCRSELLADVLKQLGKAMCTSYNLTSGGNASVKLQAYIEKRNSCAHLQIFCCVMPSEGNEHIMAARTDFIDELS